MDPLESQLSATPEPHKRNVEFNALAVKPTARATKETTPTGGPNANVPLTGSQSFKHRVVLCVECTTALQ